MFRSQRFHNSRMSDLRVSNVRNEFDGTSALAYIYRVVRKDRADF